MKEIRLNLNKLEFDLIPRQNRKLGIDSCSPKNTEIKNNFFSFMYVDCLDVYFDYPLKLLFDDEKTALKLSNDYFLE